MRRWVGACLCLSALLLGALVLTSCVGVSETSGTLSDGTSFSIECDNDWGAEWPAGATPQAATPRQALKRLVAQGSIAHSDPASGRQTKYAVPSTGWKVAHQRPNSVLFKTGENVALVRKIGRPWMVTDIELCLDH